jgi:hypothetical protein
MSEREFEELLGEPLSIEKTMKFFRDVTGAEEATVTAPQAREVTTTPSEALRVVGIVVVLALMAIASAMLIKRLPGR